MKKITLLSTIFTTASFIFASQAFADEVKPVNNLKAVENVKLESKDSKFASLYDLHKVVPESYFKEYKGKFQTINEVLEAAGISNNSDINDGIVVRQTKDASNEAIKIDTVDEFAAFIFYQKDQSEIVHRSKVDLSDVTYREGISTKGAIEQNSKSTIMSFKSVIHDAKYYWVRGYINVVRDPNNFGSIKSVNANSQLEGVHAFTVWSPSSPVITNDDWSGTVLFSGSLDIGVAAGGSFNMTVSVPVSATVEFSVPCTDF